MAANSRAVSTTNIPSTRQRERERERAEQRISGNKDRMFGALNRFIGVLDAEPSQEQRQQPESTSFGFQVLRNKDAELPLEPWFDFIVGLNGHPVVSWPC